MRAHQRRLAAARVADERDELARFDRQVDVAQHPLRGATVPEGLPRVVDRERHRAAPSGETARGEAEERHVEREADGADEDDGSDDLLEGQRVVLVPHEAADADASREHLDRDDDHPRDAHREAQARHDMRQHVGDDDVTEVGDAAEPEDAATLR